MGSFCRHISYVFKKYLSILAKKYFYGVTPTQGKIGSQ